LKVLLLTLLLAGCASTPPEGEVAIVPICYDGQLIGMTVATTGVVYTTVTWDPKEDTCSGGI